MTKKIKLEKFLNSKLLSILNGKQKNFKLCAVFLRKSFFENS